VKPACLADLVRCAAVVSALCAACAVRCDSSQGSRCLCIEVWGAGVPINLSLLNEQEDLLKCVQNLKPWSSGTFNSRVPEGKIKENKSSQIVLR